MTTWSKTPPSEPGYYWYRPRKNDDARPVYTDGRCARMAGPEWGGRVPAMDAIEAAKDALREGAHACMMQGAHVQADAMRAALAKLEGR